MMSVMEIDRPEAERASAPFTPADIDGGWEVWVDGEACVEMLRFENGVVIVDAQPPRRGRYVLTADGTLHVDYMGESGSGPYQMLLKLHCRRRDRDIFIEGVMEQGDGDDAIVDAVNLVPAGWRPDA